MSKFTPTHIALFDELVRQGIRNADVGRVLSASDLVAAYEGDRPRHQPPSRCAGGACDE